MNASEYLLGVVALAVVVGGAGLAARALRMRLLPTWAGAPARLAEVVLALAVLLGCAQALGVVGLLNRPALVAVLLVAGALGVVRRPSSNARGVNSPPRLHPPPRADLLTLAACVLGCLAVVAVWLRRSLLGLEVGMGGTDTLWFHMPFAAAFADSGSITSLLHTDTEFANAFYPANSELLHAVGIVLFGADILSPVLNLVWLALLLLATWCIGRDRRVAPLTCLAGAALAALPTLAVTQPGDAKNDVLGLACLAASIAFLHARPGGLQRGAVPPFDRLGLQGGAVPPLFDAIDTPAIVLSGLAAGIAVGTKLSFVVPALLLFGAAVAAAPGRRRAAAVWASAAVTPALVWFARNLVATGNPLPYVRDLGPVALPGPVAAPQADTEFSVAHYLGDGGLWERFFAPGLELGFGPAWWLVLGIAVAALALAAIAPASRLDRLLALAGIGAALAYLFTPQTAAGPEGLPLGFGINLRYLAPALLIALVGLPSLPALRERRGRLAAAAVLLVVVAAGLAAEGTFPAGFRAMATIAALAVVAATAGLALGLTRGRRRALTVSAVVACVLVAALGYPVQRDYLRQAYTRPSPPFTAWDAFSMNRAFAWAKGVSGARIGIAGMSGAFWQYPFTGDGDENTVRYIGARGGSGSFAAISGCRAWRRELRRGGYNYVVTTPRLDPWRPYASAPSPESRWTRSDPAAREIVAQGPVRVYALRGPMSPRACT